MILNSRSNTLLTAGFLAVVLLAVPAPTNGFFFFLRRRMDELQDRMDKFEESSLAGSDPKVATIQVEREVMFGTDEEEDSSLGKEDDLPGLILRDPDGLRLLGDPIPQQNILDTNGVRRRLDDARPSPGRILFGPTDDCTIGARSVGGIFIKDPQGLFIQNPNPKDAMSLRFGELGECRISVDPNGQFRGMIFEDPEGFTFIGPQSANGGATTSMFVDGTISARKFNAFADRTLRRHLSDIRGIDNAMERLLELRGVSFEHTGLGEQDGGTSGTRFGFVLDDFAESIPEATDFDKDESPVGVQAQVLLALVVEGIKEQHYRLESFNTQLMTKIEDLEEKVNYLQAHLPQAT